MTAPRYAVVLAGGGGTRFWPLSTSRRPKQLLPLVADRSMLADTIDRLVPLVGTDHILILTAAGLRDAILAELPGFPADQLLLEPRPAGTAAALTWAAVEVERRGGSDARMVCVHADWAVGDAARFREVLGDAARIAADQGALATVGIIPTRPDPGLGYIRPGEVIAEGARRVERFVEKPDRERAAEMIAEGCLWNSGIFAWRATDLLAEVRKRTPELASALAAARSGAEAFFAAVTNAISIDVGVMERSDRVIVLAGDFGWDDVGTWDALRRVRASDADGNVAEGRLLARESTGNVVHAGSGTVVLFGVQDLVVIVREGVTLVTTREQSHDLKSLIDALPAHLRDPA